MTANISALTPASESDPVEFVQFVVSMVGLDRPGLIGAVTTALANAGDNIDHCRSTVLCGYMTTILVVRSQPGTTEDDLQKRLDIATEDLGLKPRVWPAVESTVLTASRGKPYVISMFGPDRVGLVSGITQILAHHNVNISSIDARRFGSNTYVMHIQVEMADELLDAVASDLRRHAGSFSMEISRIDPAAAGLVATVARIRDVRLQSSFFQIEGAVPESELFRYETGYVAEVKDVGNGQLTVEVGFQLVYNPEAVGADLSARDYSVSATSVFHLTYSLPVIGLRAEDIEAFAEINGVVDALPYWRALVQSMLPSMGVHKLLVPVFRLPSALGR